MQYRFFFTCTGLLAVDIEAENMQDATHQLDEMTLDAEHLMALNMAHVASLEIGPLDHVTLHGSYAHIPLPH